MKTSRWLLMVGMGGALGLGCIKNVNSTERAEPLATPQVVKDKRIEESAALKDNAGVIGVIETTVGDLVKVQVNVYNNSSFTQTVHYRFEWYDNAGMFVDSPMSVWKPLTLQSKETIPLVSVAPTPNARDFKFKIQDSK